ncbi:MAG: hypothetical protein LBB78_02770 [Spirochaetaceae bacterium]|jgi:hypothetical protein|nr:hypothetical protein [Spirochaetaceae bacterium]
MVFIVLPGDGLQEQHLHALSRILMPVFEREAVSRTAPPSIAREAMSGS